MARGGKREGAGRPRKQPVSLAPADKGAAARVLAQIDEDAKWLELLAVNDPRLRFDVLKYLTDRRDGKPPLAIEATGKGGGPIEIVFNY